MKNSSLEKLLQKQAQLEARIKDLKSKDARQQKKNEDRKKILAGAYLLEKCNREDTYQELLLGLDSFLIRPQDRILFGLSEKKEIKAQNKQLETA